MMKTIIEASGWTLGLVVSSIVGYILVNVFTSSNVSEKTKRKVIIAIYVIVTLIPIVLFALFIVLLVCFAIPLLKIVVPISRMVLPILGLITISAFLLYLIIHLIRKINNIVKGKETIDYNVDKNDLKEHFLKWFEPMSETLKKKTSSIYIDTSTLSGKLIVAASIIVGSIFLVILILAMCTIPIK